MVKMVCQSLLVTHGFGEWGRDAMIALPGLTLSQGKHKEALKVLKCLHCMHIRAYCRIRLVLI